LLKIGEHFLDFVFIAVGTFRGQCIDDYGEGRKGIGEEAVEWVKKVNDKRAVDLMVEMDENAVIDESFESHNICCSGAVAAAIVAAKELGAVRAKEMIYSNSYDLRPDGSFEIGRASCRERV